MITSAVRSPIKRLYLRLMYWTIASSILSPATRIEWLTTMPPSEITATSVVPPPMSTIMLPTGSLIGKPAPMAAAIGAGLPINEPVGSMIVDIGGGTTEVAVISLGGIVVNHSIRVAGDEIDDAIIQYARRDHNLVIGERTAENAKIAAGSAYPLEEEIRVMLRGRDLLTGLPKSVEVSSVELRDAISQPVNTIVELIKTSIEETPPELVADIMEQGITLAGGGALLLGLDRRLQTELKMPVYRADDPLTCVARGTGRVAEALHLYERALASGSELRRGVSS